MYCFQEAGPESNTRLDEDPLGQAAIRMHAHALENFLNIISFQEAAAEQHKPSEAMLCLMCVHIVFFTHVSSRMFLHACFEEWVVVPKGEEGEDEEKAWSNNLHFPVMHALL